ncbi:MAG: molybdenum cofactor biosynthesis protein MoaE [Rhodospirillales bacterium]
MPARVQREDFDVGVETAHFGQGAGAVCMFVGLVRDLNAGRPVSAMTLEHYPGMTERELERIDQEARDRWPLNDTVIVHRYGRLEPGDRIVLVAVASARRDAAFEACRFIIDSLKTRAPFWKAEESHGAQRWVEAREEDQASDRRWDVAGAARNRTSRVT